MDLAKFAQIPPENNGVFLKFTPNDNVKIVRFLYLTTAGSGEDLGILCRQKLYDAATKKVIWDAPEGKWTMTLKCAIYSSKSEFTMMSWDRSAAFGRDILLPLFESAGGRICDQVYKITCTKAGTLDAVFSFFPIKDSEAYAMPNLSAESTEVAQESEVPPAPITPVPPVATQTAKASAPVTKPQATVGATASGATPVQATAGTAKATSAKKRNFWEEQ